MYYFCFCAQWRSRRGSSGGTFPGREDLGVDSTFYSAI